MTVLDRPLVAVGRGVALEEALRTFKRRLESSGLFGELRRHESYETPGERRRRKHRRAIARATRPGRRDEAADG